jgi:hypothetical protein
MLRELTASFFKVEQSNKKHAVSRAVCAATFLIEPFLVQCSPQVRVDFIRTTKHYIPEDTILAVDRCANLGPNTFVCDLFSGAVSR